MPELPEVETIKNDLKDVLIGKTIRSFVVREPKTIAPMKPRTLNRTLTGQEISGLDRKAKILIIALKKGGFLTIHLKMTGQLIYRPPHGPMISGGHPQPGGLDQLPNRYTRLYLTFTDGSYLYFNDLRKFGWLHYQADLKQEPGIKKSGPEPLGREFTFSVFKNILNRYPNRNIKHLLLDQTLIAGLGNIYTDESLFVAGIKPNRTVKNITTPEAQTLYRATKKILRLAVKKKGTSFRNYVRSTGETGGFVPYLKVYGRSGKPCLKCQQPITKTVIANRGTHFCPYCQK